MLAPSKICKFCGTFVTSIEFYHFSRYIKNSREYVTLLSNSTVKKVTFFVHRTRNNHKGFRWPHIYIPVIFSASTFLLGYQKDNLSCKKLTVGIMVVVKRWDLGAINLNMFPSCACHHRHLHYLLLWYPSTGLSKFSLSVLMAILQVNLG